MNDTDYELVERWLNSEEEEVKIHAIHWLEEYYEENFEPKEDRIVDLLLSQLDEELVGFWTRTYEGTEEMPGFQFVMGRYYLRLKAVKMLGENTRPYEGRIASKIVRVAEAAIRQSEDNDADQLALAAVEALGHFGHPESVRFLKDECIDTNEQIAKESLWSLKRIMFNGISSQLNSKGEIIGTAELTGPDGANNSLTVEIFGHILNVATSPISISFEVRSTALHILRLYKTIKDMNEHNGFWFDDNRHIIASKLQFILGDPLLMENYGYSPDETEKIKSLMELTLIWNNGKIEPYCDIANAMVGLADNPFGVGKLATEEQMREQFDCWKLKLERDLPDLNEEEQYEQFALCIDSAVKWLDLLMLDNMNANFSVSNKFWFEKDMKGGVNPYDKYL